MRAVGQRGRKYGCEVLRVEGSLMVEGKGMVKKVLGFLFGLGYGLGLIWLDLGFV